MSRIVVVIASGLLIMVGALAFTLSQSPITVASTSTVGELSSLGTLTKKTKACQYNEVIPREVTAIRLRALMFTGARVTVTASAGGHVIAQGERASGWTGGVVTMPVEPLPTQTQGVQICFGFYLNGSEAVSLLGGRSRVTPPGQHANPRLRRATVEYLRQGSSSWWSLATQVARRMGLGHAGSGTWCVFLVLALMGGVIVLVSRLTLRELQ